jgi:L-iditol 2-dehydrogenase
MKTVSITGPRRCELTEVPDPLAKENFCVVKITAAPMCTEYKSYKNGEISSCLGHEAAGEVVETGPAARTVKKGDRVVVMPCYPCGKCFFCRTGNYIHCQSGVNPLEICGCKTGTATYAQYCLKQDWLLLPIPDDMSYEHASMACCGLGPAFGAARKLNINGFDTVLITGLGPVGLGGVITGLHSGARVIAADIHPGRRQTALDFGASAAVDSSAPDALEQIRALTGGLGADKALECTGIPEAQNFTVQAVRRLGQVGFIGWGGGPAPGNMIPDGRTLHGCWHWNLNDYPKMLRLIKDSAKLIDKQITHRFPMSRVQEAWELQLTGNCGKIILDPRE